MLFQKQLSKFEGKGEINMPTTKQLFAQWEIDAEFGRINDRGSEHSREPKPICAKSELSKRLDSMKKRSPFDNGDKGLKR